MKIFSSVGGFLKKLFTHTNWTHTAQATLSILAPAVETLVTIYGGPVAGAATTALLNEVQSDFGVVSHTLAQAQNGALPGDKLSLVESSLKSIQANIGGLEAAGHIEDPATKEKVTTTVSLISSELGAILSMLPQSAPVVPAAVAAPVAVHPVVPGMPAA